MDYLTGSPVYEFPYSGYNTSSTPFLNNNTNTLLPNYAPALNNLLYNEPSTITMHCTPQITSIPRGNSLVFYVSNDVSLNTIFRQLGIDACSLQQPSSLNNYYTSPLTEVILPRRRSDYHRQLICHNASDSESDYYPKRSSRSDHHQRLICREASYLDSDECQRPPFRSHRRRRIICREDSDSDRDDDEKYSSRHHRRQNRHQHHSGPDMNQGSQSPAGLHSLLGNVWQRMAGAPEYPPQSNVPPSHPGAMKNVWQHMQNAPPPMPPPGNQSSGGIASLLAKMSSGGGNVNMPPQQNQAPVQSFPPVSNLPAGTHQPSSGVSKVWNMMSHPPQQGAPLPVNPSWNQPSAPPSAMNSVWGQMSSAPAMNPVGNQMLPPPAPPSAMNSVWAQMSSAPAMNPVGNQMLPPPAPPMNPAASQTSPATSNVLSKMFGQ
ncbi:unnamed protein product [Rotaria sp. Silwood2]|nr:unnamed protein product [Rotaria sp. Silwood2]CAF4100734.1 unnamed protein product [Rotaria sp. Silwood2]